MLNQPGEAALPKPSELKGDLSGETLDRYKLEKLLGVGGMGRVYSAVQTSTKRRCALKLLPDELCKNPNFVARFQAETEMLARLSHPNIVHLYSGGEAQSRFFLEMEYIDGGDLQTRVAEKFASTGTGLGEADAIRITDGVLAALEYAHNQGVIHRDLKPANILLSTAGDVKVSDFGLAAVVGEDMHRSMVQTSLTSVSLAQVTSMETVAFTPGPSNNAFVGTILYMSPQALRSDPADKRDDLFSLGVVVYYMLTGRTPAVNYTPVSKIRKDLKLKWDPFIATCLAEDRKDRFATATDARKAFALAQKSSSKTGLIVGVAAAMILAFAGAGFLGWKFWSQHSSRSSLALNSSSHGGVKLAANGSSVAGGGSSSGGGDGGGGGDNGSSNSNGGSGGGHSNDASSGSPAVSGGSAGQQGQEITFSAPADHPVDGSLIPLSATASSGLRVRFSVVDGPAQVVGSQVMLTGPGLVTIRAAQPGDATHAAAASVDRSFQALAPKPAVEKKPQVIAFDRLENAVLGDPPVSPSVRADSGLPVNIVVVSGPAKVHDHQVMVTGLGKVTLRAEQAGDDNYQAAQSVEKTFTVEPAIPAKLTVTLPGNVTMNFVRVPAGRATLGSPDGEIGHKPEEALHNYSEPEGFLMSATEVTQAQYEAVTGKRPSYFRSEWETRPVEQVRWSDITNNNTGATTGFFPQLNTILQKAGQTRWVAMLPSDDQWEYACRAGSSTSYNNNTDLTIPLVEHDIREVATYSADETSPVATHAPNAWGLYDMHGNVAEWTQEGSLRGGSFRDDPSSIRSASRVFGKAGQTNPDKQVGFRIILRRAPAAATAE